MSESDKSPLHLAENLSEAQKILVHNPGLIHQADEQGVKPIHIAAARSTPEHVELLVSHNANLEDLTFQHKTPLHYASMANNIPMLEWLIEKNLNINCVDKKAFCTPLVYAAMLNNVAACITLVKAGCNLDLSDNTGSTVLHYSVRNNQRELTSLLIQQGMQSDVKDIHGCTALHYAATNGNLDIVRLLIHARANLLALNNSGHIPMHLAAAGGHIAVVKEFLAGKVPYDYPSPKNAGTALYFAALSGELELCEHLVSLGAELFHQCNGGQTPLHAAATRGHLACVKLLLKLGSNVTIEDDLRQIALHKAAKYGHVACVEYLQRKAPHTLKYQDSNGHSPLILASIGKHAAVFDLLLQRESSSFKWVDKQGRSPVHWAACAGHSTLLRELLKGSSIEQVDQAGRTPLHWAISSGDEESVRVLLELGASLSSTCKLRNNSIHYAALLGNPTILLMLFGQRNLAEINSLNGANYSPVLLAASRGHSAAVKFLMDRGAQTNLSAPGGNSILHLALKGGCDLPTIQAIKRAAIDINQKNDAGQTPLHFASCRDNVEVVKWLISNGANVKAQCTEGNSPAHMAANFGCANVLKLLISSSCDPNKANNNQARPIDFATKRSHHLCISILS